MQDQVVHFFRTGKWNSFPVVILAFTETTIDGFQLTSEMLKCYESEAGHHPHPLRHH